MSNTYAGIGAPETLPIDKLNLYHKNPRKGDVEAIKSSLVANGQFRPIVINKGSHTGRPFEVIAGNHTLKAFRELAEENPDEKRWQQIDCWVVDVDEERATKIVLVDNRTADLGVYDEGILSALLETVDHDLDGTGYDYEDLDDLRVEAEEITEALTEYPSNAESAQPQQAPSDHTDSTGDREYRNEDGIGQSNGQTAAAPGYASRPTRMMIMNYPMDQFIWVQESLEKVHADHPEFEHSHARALIHFLEEATGDTAPADEKDGE